MRIPRPRHLLPHTPRPILWRLRSEACGLFPPNPDRPALLLVTVLAPAGLRIFRGLHASRPSTPQPPPFTPLDFYPLTCTSS